MILAACRARRDIFAAAAHVHCMCSNVRDRFNDAAEFSEIAGNHIRCELNFRHHIGLVWLRTHSCRT